MTGSPGQPGLWVAKCDLVPCLVEDSDIVTTDYVWPIESPVSFPMFLGDFHGLVRIV